MAMIRPETEMKDSGVKWIGDIPESWTIRPLKSLYTLTTGFTPNSKDDSLYDENGETWVTIGDLKGDIIYNSKQKISKKVADMHRAEMTKQGSLMYSFKLSVGAVAVAGKDLFTNEAIASFLPKNRHGNLHYLKYASSLIIGNANTNIYGAFIMNQQLILNAPLPLPSPDEQQAIVDYLDETCFKIDEIIAEAKASIDEYKNLREAVISNATTRGIKKNRSLKSSGVEWVLEIPSDWNMIPAKVLFLQSNERKHVDDVQLTASQKYGIISQVEYMKRENSRIVIATQGIENWKHVEPNDFIISLRSFQGGLEKSDVSGCITWHYVVLKANNGVYYDYFKWLFKSDKYINALQGTCNFIRDGQDLRFSNFVQVPLLVVPIEEQKEIADYLNKKVPKIDSLISEKESLINDLEAYKKSLIYEVVTGKRRVV